MYQPSREAAGSARWARLRPACTRCMRHERTLRRAHSPGSAATCAADDKGCADTDPFVRGIRLAWWSTGPGCGPADDFSAPCWSVYAEDRLTGRLTPCGN